MQGDMPQGDFERLAALLGEGRHADLDREAERLAGQYPADGRCWQLLGVSQLARNRNEAALPLLQRASQLAPRNATILDNLGLVQYRLRDFRAADESFRQSTELQPGLVSAWVNWSANSCAAGDCAAAAHQARHALQLNRSLPAAWLNLANAWLEAGQHGDAESAYISALRLQPGLPDALLGYGMLLDAAGRPSEAIRCFEGVLRASPGSWRALANLGKIHSSLGNSAQASECYRAALRSPDAAAEVHSGLLFLRLYEEGADPADVLADHREFGRRVEAPFVGLAITHDNARDEDRPLRLGFVSGDFRVHPVAHFFEPFLAGLDRSRFKVFLYSSHPREDEMSQRLAELGDWIRVGRLSDDELADRIRSDRIDILIDLAGHSSYNRLPAFARRPAPIQVSWLGYPATTGMHAIDYRPIYAAADPDRTLQSQFSENLVHVTCLPTFRSPATLPDVGLLPASARGSVTFANLNRSDKLGPAVIRVWSEILRRLPSARLLLGAVPNEAVGETLRARFAERGIPASRLDLRPRMGMSDYLALHQEVDILLDPFPFSGLTTTEHAVSMGVPVLTLAGSGLVGRQGLVVMVGLGLTEWVAWSEEEYVEKAVCFGGDFVKLALLRGDLRGLASRPQFFGLGEAQVMTAVFREMWQRWCRGMSPAPFGVESNGVVF